MRVASGADSGSMDILPGDTGPVQLMPADCPQIEMMPSDAKRPQRTGDLLLVIDELGAAGPQRRPDGCNHPFRSAIEFRDHACHRPADDIGHIAPPAAMNVGRHPRLGIDQHDRLAVRRLDQQAYARHIGNQRIGLLRCGLNRCLGGTARPGESPGWSSRDSAAYKYGCRRSSAAAAYDWP